MGVLRHEDLQEIQKPLIGSREANVFSVVFTVVFFSVFSKAERGDVTLAGGCRLCRGPVILSLTGPKTQAQAGPCSHAGTAASQQE